jgi:flagellar biosynthesis protein FlhA
MADVPVQNSAPAGLAGGLQQFIMPLSVVVVVVMMIVPLPTVLLDMFMAMNLMLALVILLTVLYVKKASDFTVFPTMLLLLTVFGLALNVSSTRLILTRGERFDGRMIRAFSTFVVGSGNTEGLVVGFVIFIVIIAVQVLVITKGATRISEVAARFALDSMNPKQMNIESQLNQGYITEQEAKAQSNELRQELDFYSRMDGASKFIQGNVQVGIFITVVNILGGIIIGSTIHGEPLSAAVSTYIAFSVGDGLLTQFPAILISTATGIMMARSMSNNALDKDIADTFKREWRIYMVGASVLLLFSFLPGFPWYVLIPLAALMFLFAARLRTAKRREASAGAAMAKAGEKAKKSAEETGDLPVVLPLDDISLEIGYSLVPLVDKNNSVELLERIKRVRRESALELGLVIPKIRIIDSLMLEPSEYCFKIKGVDVGRGKIRIGSFLCINPGTVSAEIAGEKTIDPAFGLPAVWVRESQRDEAERSGYTVVDPPTIIATHLQAIIRHHAADLLGYQETQQILDELKKNYPAVVEAVLATQLNQKEGLSLGRIQKVLQGLLREQVSIRNLVSVMEAMADFSPVTKEVWFLVEKCRQALAGQICSQFADENRRIRVLTIEKNLEEEILKSRVETSSGESIAVMDPAKHRDWIKALSKSVTAVQQQHWVPVLLCSESVRHLVRSSCERELPQLAVLSVHEIASDFTVESVGTIRIE